MRRLTPASARQLARQQLGIDGYKHPHKGSETLPFTAWEIESLAASLRERAELPGLSTMARTHLRRLSTRLQLANPTAGA